MSVISYGDTVVVDSGHYAVNLWLPAFPILIISAHGASHALLTPIDPTIPVVTFAEGVDTSMTIRGFTIEGTTHAPGVMCQLGRPSLENCVIRNCANDSDGGAIQLRKSGVRVVECELYNNTSEGIGGAIGGTTSDAGRVSIQSCLIHHNAADSGAAIGFRTLADRPLIERNRIYRNHGNTIRAAGIYGATKDPTILNNTIVLNTSGLFVSVAGLAYFIEGCIVVYNDSVDVNGVPWSNFNTWSNPWIFGAITDPRFIDTSRDDFSLQLNSRCVNTGPPSPQYADPDGSRNDMGALPTSLTYPLALDFQTINASREYVVPSHCEIGWSFTNTRSAPQTAFSIQVGSDRADHIASMWNPGVCVLTETTVTYNGLPLQPGVIYSYRVSVTDGANWGDWTYGEFRTNALPPIPVPQFPVGDTVPADYVVLSASVGPIPDDNGAVTDFVVTTDSTISSIVAADSGAQTSYLAKSRRFDELSSNRKYWWRARVRDAVEVGPWSAPVPFYTRSGRRLIVPSQFPTIAAAIAAADNGDSVAILAGLYRGSGNRDLLIESKGIVLYSASGVGKAIIDCEGDSSSPHRALVLGSNLVNPYTCTIDGLLIKNGYASQYGGGVLIVRGSPVFRNCTFRNNKAWEGGAIGGEGFTANVYSCYFDANHVTFGGGAIGGSYILNLRGSDFFQNVADYTGSAVHGAGVSMVGCSCDRNFSTGWCVDFGGDGNILVDSSFFVSSGGGAINLYRTWPGLTVIRNCTVVHNASGIFMDDSYPIITNTIVAYNNGASIQCRSGGGYPWPGDPTLDHCNLFGNANGLDYYYCVGVDAGVRGNISLDPQFCDLSAGNYKLNANSPCVGAGAEGVNIGAFGVGCGVLQSINDTASANAATKPIEFVFQQNFPNPFNPTTSIPFTLPAPCHVRIEIYNLVGQRVLTLCNEDMSSGAHELTWNGTDNSGKEVASGIYFCRIHAADWISQKQMLLVK